MRLEDALAAVKERGWRVAELGRYVDGTPAEQPEPWFCMLWPAHFGRHFPGTRGEDGAYRNAMAMMRGNGSSALAAVEDAIKALDASKASRAYDDMLRAFERAVAAQGGQDVA